jgi:glycosyltransferase involved in cell wall biosynthesis
LIDYLHKKNKVPLKKIDVLPNGVVLEKIYGSLDKRYDVRDELKISKKSFVAVSVGRIQNQKNMPALAGAMRFVDKNIVLAIVGGEGGEKKDVENAIKKYKLEKRVFLMGERRDVPRILDSADAFILASFKEGMSNALLEAMALKKCSLVSNIPQNTELIKDGFNGFVFNHFSEKDMAEKIEKAYKSKELKKLGENSFKLIKEKYETSKVIAKYKSIIVKIANTK